MTALEKLQEYDKQLAEGDLDVEGLKKLRRKIYRVDTCFEPAEAIVLKAKLLTCIKELLE